MSKHTIFTTVTPLPAGVTRQIVLDFLHDHEEMIDLNPLVKERHPIPTPSHASVDELSCQWFSLTDKISYFPGLSGDITYTCAFHHLSNGVQTHCYAPAGLTIREKWTVGGVLPGEPEQPGELGLKLPPTGLYLCEDVDMRCNIIMAGFVKKTLRKSHAALVDRLKIKAQIASTNSSGGIFKLNTLTLTASAASTASRRSSASNHQNNQSVSAPATRPSSAASSVTSAPPSPSYTPPQRSPTWSSAISSPATSPTLSAKSPPTTHNSSSYPNQHYHHHQQQPSLNFPPHKQDSFSIPRRAVVPEPTPAPVPVPDTPFLSQKQPNWPWDWPLRSPTIPTPAPPAKRPQSDMYTYTYTPPAPHSPAGEAKTRGGMLSDDALWKALGRASGGGTAYHPSAAAAVPVGDGRSSRGAMADDALWRALGGGRFVVRNGGSGSGSDNGNGSSNGREIRGHPDYPEMNPYDEMEDESIGLGVVGRRPVSMPPPLRVRSRSGLMEGGMGGQFIAELH